MEYKYFIHLDIIKKLENVEPKNFSEPWMARAFGLVSVISESKLFSLKDFQHALIESIKKREVSSCIEDEEEYYNCWIDAMETLLAKKKIIKDDLIKKYENKITSNSASIKEHQHLSARDQNGKLLIKPLCEF